MSKPEYKLLHFNYETRLFHEHYKGKFREGAEKIYNNNYIDGEKKAYALSLEIEKFINNIDVESTQIELVLTIVDNFLNRVITMKVAEAYINELIKEAE